MVAVAVAAEAGAGRRPRVKRRAPRRERTSRRRGRVRRWPASCAAVGATEAAGYRDRIQPFLTGATPDIRAAATFAATHSRAETATVSAALVSTVPFEELAARVGAVTGDVALGTHALHPPGLRRLPHGLARGDREGARTSAASRRATAAPSSSSRILRPAAKIAQGFATNFFDTTDGRHFEGFVVREGGTEVVIRDLAGRRDDDPEGSDQGARRARRVDHAAGTGGHADPVRSCRRCWRIWARRPAR